MALVGGILCCDVCKKALDGEYKEINNKVLCYYHYFKELEQTKNTQEEG